jgi:flagellar hook-associated protein 2
MGSFSIPGIGSGIDWSKYIQSIRDAETQAVQRTLGKQQFKNGTQQATYGQVKGLTDALKSTVMGFQFAKDFKTKTVNSSDQNVVTGTATVTALNTSTTFTVEQLATNEVFQASFAGLTSVVTSADGVFNLTVRGQVKSVAVPAGTTLTGLAGLINSAGIGVSAQAFDTGSGGATPARLTITDNLTGQADTDNTTWHPNLDFSASSTLTDLLNSSFAVQIQGQDSKITIGTNDIYRDDNTVADALPGITLHLVSADPGVDKTITVSEDTSSAATKIKDFINKYNSLVQGLQTATKYDPNQSEQQNQTAGDPTLRGVLGTLMSSVTATQWTLPAGSTINSLADLGVTSSKDVQGPKAGQLEFDEAKFNAVLASNYDAVVQFFEGKVITSGEVSTTYPGFGKNMTDIVGGFLDTDGAISARMTSLQKDATRIDDQIQKKVERIAAKETFLKDKFARLESLLSKLNSQMASNGSALASLAGNKI